ncbi:hypothetical protein BH23ACT9_BH23ACT9_37020 [soil metagenome]
MSNQPPPPFGQPQEGGWGPQGHPPSQPPGYGGQPPGYGGQPPGYEGQPPGYGGQPPGYGGAPPPPGFSGPGGPPSGNGKAPLIVGIVAAVLIVAIAAGVFLFLRGRGDDTQLTAGATDTETETETAGDPTEETEEPRETAAPRPRPTQTMPAPPPEPSPSDPAPPPAPPPAPSGTSMDMGEGVQGEITSAALVQEFFFTGSEGEEIVLTMTALDEGLDPVMALFDPSGTLLEENDDDLSLPTSTDSRIQIRLPVDGEYRVEARSFAETTGRFDLSLQFPSVLNAVDTTSDAVPEILYDYTGAAEQTIVITMRALDDTVDPLLTVLDPSGNEIGRDDDGGGFPNARLQLTLPADGTYTIVAGVFGSRYGEFELTVAEL